MLRNRSRYNCEYAGQARVSGQETCSSGTAPDRSATPQALDRLGDLRCMLRVRQRRIIRITALLTLFAVSGNILTHVGIRSERRAYFRGASVAAPNL